MQPKDPLLFPNSSLLRQWIPAPVYALGTSSPYVFDNIVTHEMAEKNSSVDQEQEAVYLCFQEGHKVPELVGGRGTKSTQSTN